MVDAYGTVAKRGLVGALPRYMVAATLARGADGGAAVGLVLLATSPATGLRHGAAAGGLLAAAAAPLGGVLTLAGASVAAAGVRLTLPPSPRGAAREGAAMTVRAALRLIAVSGPLRRVAVATALTAASFGALSVIAVLLGE